MYAWKYWRDSRDRVILYGAASLAVGIMLGVINASWYRVELAHEWRYRRLSQHWNPALWVYYGSIDGVTTFLLPAAIWAAVTLAAVSVGREYTSGAMPFLLTRPARRWTFVWTDWGLGLAQVAAIAVAMVVGILPFLVYTSRQYVGQSWPVLLGALALPAALFGLTHFMTVLTGSSMKGLSATTATILLYMFLPGALEEWWHIHTPLAVRDWSLSLVDWSSGEFHFVFHGWPVLMWFVVALIFPFLSQLILDRREV